MQSNPQPPATRPVVGLVGAGQLARMGWQAAISLDVGLLCLGAAGDAAALAGAPVMAGSARDGEALAALAGRSDVLSFEHELVDLDALARLEAEGVRVRPGTTTLRLAADKLHQRRTLAEIADVRVPPFAPVAALDDVHTFAAQHGWPLVLKARSGGYDGRGVWMCDDASAATRALADAAAAELELYAEQAVRLAGEAAVLVARSPSGEIAVYPPVATHQRDGMCRWVTLPAGLPEALEQQIDSLARTLARATALEGLMAVELFLDRDGGLLVNELALRTHNTGHLHTEAAATSQFEQHLRAVLDLPLGETAPVVAAAAMVNVVGPADGSDPATRLAGALAVPGAHVHLYGKLARPGRKLGHVTVCGSSPQAALDLAKQAADRLEGNG